VVFIDDQPEFTIAAHDGKWEWRGQLTSAKVAERYPTKRPVPKDQFMIRLMARAPNCRSAGVLLLIE